MTKSRRSDMSDNMRRPRQKAERSRANQRQPGPARRSEEGAPRIKEPADTATEASLRQAEQIFQAIFDNTSDGIFLLDLEARRFTMCNQSCLQMLGYTQEEFLSLSIADLHAPDDLPSIYSQIEELLKGGKPAGHDVRFRRKDGSVVFTDLSPRLLVLEGRRYILVALKDITERKRAEQTLQSERDQARQYLRVAGVMIVALDADGHITLINEKGCEILGYRQEEILGRDWFDVCLPREIRAEVRDVFHRLMAGDITPVEYYENVVLRQDGQPRIVAFHNTVLRDSSSRIVGVLFSGADITERTRVEEALAASEQKYRSLVQNIPDVTWTTDREGRTLFISPNVREVYGYSAAEICTGGDTWLGNVHPDDRPRIEKAFGALFTRKKPYDIEYRIRRKDGTWIWLHDRSMSSYKKDGRWYADGVFSEITERKRMEEELREHAEHLEELVAARTSELQDSEARYRSLYHTIADGVFVMGVEGRIEDVNDSACAQLGYTRAELIGMPVSAVSARSDFNLGEIFARLRATGSLSYETTHRRKDGSIVSVELSVTPIEYRGRPAILGVARDITERKRAEETLRFTQFAIDHTADAAFWMTEDAGLFYVNEAACRTLGYSREELLQMTVYDIDPAFTESMWRESWRKLRAEKSIVLETVHRARDGRVYPVEIRANYLEFGGRAYDCAFARDITERKHAEEALRESKLHLVRAQQIAHMGSWSWDIAQDHLYCSDETYRLFGLQPGERTLRQADFLGFLHPQDRPRVEQALREALVHGRYDCEYRIVHGDAQGRYMYSHGQTTFDPGGTPVKIEGTVQDITERRQAEEALRELNATLETRVAQRTAELHHRARQLQKLTLELSQAEDRERKRIADILHEDVQQTLAAARFHLNLLGSETRSVEESQEIIEQVKRMLRDAIERSRDLSHELSPALYQVDLPEILNWLARHMRQKYGLTVRVEAYGPVDSPSEPLKAFLYKVAQELLFNVVKHAGVSEARIRVRRMGPSVYLSVTDWGSGFDPQQLEGMAGFGLLGIRERVQLLGGRMKIRSRADAGSRVLIVVPDQEAARVGVPAGYGRRRLPA
jgi:PAS domain S-box-containing protein